MNETTKAKPLNAINREKFPLDKTLRWASILILLVIIIGMFQPLVGAKARIAVESGETLGIEIPIVKDDTSIVEFSSTDFILHKQLRDYAIFGQKLGDIEIFGIKIYDFLTSPFPDLTVLSKATEFLNSDTLEFLTNPDLMNFCTQYLGDIGEGVVSLCQAISDVATQAKDVLAQVSTVMDNLKTASDTLNEGIQTVEGYMTIVDNLFLIWALLIILFVALFLIDKGPRFLPAIFLSVFSLISLVVGIAIAVVNSAVSGELATLVQNLNTTMQDSLAGLIPNASGVVSTALSASGLKLAANFNLYCGLGWWLITIGLFACTAVAYIAPIMKKRRLANNAPADSSKTVTDAN